MTHWTDEDDDDDSGDWDGDDGPTLSEAEQPDPADTDPADTDPADTDPDDAGTVVPCPFCRRAVHEDADLCPGCGNFIGGSDDPSPRRPTWVTVGLIACLVAMLVSCAIRMW